MWRYLDNVDRPSKGPNPGEKRKYNQEYEKSKRKREFQSGWTENRPWLKNTASGMQCQYCISQSLQNSFVSGCTSMKIDSIKKHEDADSHKRAASIEMAKSKPKYVSTAAKTLQKLNAAVFQKLTHMFRTCHALVINNRPLTDFTWMCNLDDMKGLEVGETYRNHKSAQVFVKAIAETECHKIADELSNCSFICLIGDGSTDYGVQEQEMWYCRTARAGQINTYLLGVHKPEKADAPSLVGGVKQLCENMQLQWHDFSPKLVALACDGASVMLGCRAGVGALLQREQPSLITIHCMAHRLELSLKDMSKSVNLYVKTVDTLLLGLYLFYHKSSLNRSMLKRSFEALRQKDDGDLLMPVRVGGTRWIAHTLRAVTNIVGAYRFIVAHLEQMIQTSEKVSGVAKAKARAFLKLLQSKSIVYFLYYLLDALTPLRRLSRLLQDRQAVLGVQHTELSSTIDVINKYTDSDGPNLRKVSQQAAVSGLKGSDAEFVSARKHMTPLIAKAMEKRFSEFSSPGVVHATRIADMSQWPKSWDNLKDYGDQELQMLLEHFEPTLVKAGVKPDEAEIEWTMLKKELLSTNKLPCSWTTVNEVMSQKFSNILPVMDLIMTLSPSSAEAERGFSQLKLIKTRLRTRLSQPVLNNLLCIKLAAPSIEQFDPTSAINHWNTSGSRMRRPNYKDNIKSSEPVHNYEVEIVDDNDSQHVDDNDSPISGTEGASEQVDEPVLPEECGECYSDSGDSDNDYESDIDEHAVFKRLLCFNERD